MDRGKRDRIVEAALPSLVYSSPRDKYASWSGGPTTCITQEPGWVPIRLLLRQLEILNPLACLSVIYPDFLPISDLFGILRVTRVKWKFLAGLCVGGHSPGTSQLLNFLPPSHSMTWISCEFITMLMDSSSSFSIFNSQRSKNPKGSEIAISYLFVVVSQLLLLFLPLAGHPMQILYIYSHWFISLSCCKFSAFYAPSLVALKCNYMAWGVYNEPWARRTYLRSLPSSLGETPLANFSV